MVPNEANTGLNSRSGRLDKASTSTVCTALNTLEVTFGGSMIVWPFFGLFFFQLAVLLEADRLQV